jgi:hypothetical protein
LRNSLEYVFQVARTRYFMLESVHNCEQQH